MSISRLLTFTMTNIQYPLPSREKEITGLSVATQNQRTFITSDLHLDHTNIIRYCKRPFASTEEMNRVLLNNWNNVIRENDLVYFLGDLAYGRGSNSTDYWLKKLNGDIVFLKGNHDKSDSIRFYDNYILEYAGISFYLTHDPISVPIGWNDWAICGHPPVGLT